MVESNFSAVESSDLTEKALGRTSPKPKVRATRSYTTSTIELHRKEKGRKEHREEKLLKILGESMDGGLDLYREQGKGYSTGVFTQGPMKKKKIMIQKAKYISYDMTISSQHILYIVQTQIFQNFNTLITSKLIFKALQLC